MKLTFYTTLSYTLPDETELEDQEVTVEAEISGGDPGVRTYPNGDPGYPPSDPDVDLTGVFNAEGKDIQHLLTDAVLDDLIVQALEESERREADAQADLADREYDAWKDRSQEL